MIQLNSWTKLQIGHLCFGNGCFKREKTLFYDMQILFPTFTFTFTYVHISITQGSPFTPFEFEIPFFWCLNHTSANYSICFSSHYQMHFWMQMRCKTCLNFEMSVVKTLKKKILVSRFLLDAVGLEWLCSCLSVQSEQDKEPKTDQLQEGLFNLKKVTKIGIFFLVKSSLSICMENRRIPGAILAIDSKVCFLLRSSPT